MHFFPFSLLLAYINVAIQDVPKSPSQLAFGQFGIVVPSVSALLFLIANIYIVYMHQKVNKQKFQQQQQNNSNK